MDNLLDVYANNLKDLFSMTEITRQIHNGYSHKIIKGTNYDIIISNELGTQNYRVSISFQSSKKVFYIDLLMRYDDSYNKQIPDIHIPVQMQLNYIKERKEKIISELWCENVMKNFQFDESDFIKKLNSLCE